MEYWYNIVGLLFVKCLEFFKFWWFVRILNNDVFGNMLEYSKFLMVL